MRLLCLDRIEFESRRLSHNLSDDQTPVTAHKRLVYISLWVGETETNFDVNTCIYIQRNATADTFY
ncbi:hypothetical protein V8C37DRAFT_376657 [Trichoderma ceciliae]